MDAVLALRALAAILEEPALCRRFLALSGFDPETLRARVAAPETAEAVAAFLSGHEPDLIRVADPLGVPPERLAR